MPNIEIHGMEKQMAEKERENIFELFKGKEYVRDIVVTIFPTDVRDRCNRKLAFIRLVSSDHLREATVLLLELGLDLEILELQQFIGGGKRNEKFKFK
ncbi:MAG TPA: hypothetical protein VMZ91_09405 [Candidatus Paceibacterota bacterium]|nr:hypothetical protein [Candidatus Paceibacterota bacterium]